MAVKTREEIMNTLRERFGDDTSDETLNLLEDIDDTLGDRSNVEELQRKYDELDKTWRQKYRDRFFNTPAKDENNDNDSDNDNDDKPRTYTFEELFKEA